MFQTTLPVLDNPFSQRLREMVDSFRAQRSRYMKVIWKLPSFLQQLRHYRTLSAPFSTRRVSPSDSAPLSLSRPPAADGGEAGGPERADLPPLPDGGQERRRRSVVRGLPVSHAQGDPPAPQLGAEGPLPIAPFPTKPV